MLLRLDQPLDLATTLESGQAFRWQHRGGWWHGIIREQVVLLREGPGGLEYRTGMTPPEQMGKILSHYFRLDDDLHAIHGSLIQDRRLAEAVQHNPGLRLLRQEPWECLIAFICSQNSNIPRISGTMERLALNFGRAMTLGKVTLHTFPSSDILAEAGEPRLRALGLGYRAGYVARTAQIVAGGGIDLESLCEEPYERAKEALLALPGVGEKVADCVLLFSLEKLEAFPIDRWVQRALEDWYMEGRRVPHRELNAWAREQFGPHAGYAQQYLFYRRRSIGKQS